MDRWLRRAFRRAGPLQVAAAALLALAGAWELKRRLHARTLEALAVRYSLSAPEKRLARELSETLALRDLKEKDLVRFKEGLTKLAESKRTVYEGGLLLQEDKRLLEKQWEIMTTWLMVDEAAGKVHLMRGEQALESHAVEHSPARAFGWDAKPPAAVERIVSKERFAHPERGRYLEADGKLQWTPPQVGVSTRSAALGEFVMFTSGSLILHGPPLRPREHEEFPHYCLGLPTATARKLYASGSIGTKILIKPPQPSPKR